MPTPPEKGETRQGFMGRCMGVMTKEAKDKPRPQQIAICFSMWRKAHPSDKGAKNPNEGK